MDLQRNDVYSRPTATMFPVVVTWCPCAKAATSGMVMEDLHSHLKSTNCRGPAFWGQNDMGIAEDQSSTSINIHPSPSSEARDHDGSASLIFEARQCWSTILVKFAQSSGSSHSAMFVESTTLQCPASDSSHLGNAWAGTTLWPKGPL